MTDDCGVAIERRQTGVIMTGIISARGMGFVCLLLWGCGQVPEETDQFEAAASSENPDADATREVRGEPLSNAEVERVLREASGEKLSPQSLEGLLERIPSTSGAERKRLISEYASRALAETSPIERRELLARLERASLETGKGLAQ